MKRVLLTATELHMDKFWVRHIDFLQKQGYEVDLVCSHVGDRLEDLKSKLKNIDNDSLKIIRLKRSPYSPFNILGYFDLKRILSQKRYDCIITNEPVMGTVTRLAAKKHRKHGTKVVYFAHGFHFFKGSSKLMWLIFYPIERVMSRFTDTLVTMNNEDYDLATRKMNAVEVKKIHGIGVDLSKFYHDDCLREKKRRELGIDDDVFLLFTASELIERKNLPMSVDIVKELHNKGYNVKLYVRGEGKDKEMIEDYITSSGMNQYVILMGYGKDICEMCNAADADLFTSKQEGLPVALMEAMSCKLPCVVTNIRGAVDLIQDGSGGYVCENGNVEQFVDRIVYLINHKDAISELVDDNHLKLAPYSIDNVEKCIEKMIN